MCTFYANAGQVSGQKSKLAAVDCNAPSQQNAKAAVLLLTMHYQFDVFVTMNENDNSIDFFCAK